MQSGAATTTLTGDAVTYTGTTTVGQGTLALRSGATLVHSEAIRLTSPGARLDPGAAGLRVLTALSGKGTVLGSVTSDSLVATGLTVKGDYTQHKRGELALQHKPLKVTGRVALSGALDLSAAGTAPARRITVIDHTGRAPTTGAFDGLTEGTAVKLADTVYRITYRGGDGNDVLLDAESAHSSAEAGTPDTTPSAPPTVTTRTAANPADDAFGWWPYALALGLLGGMVVPAGLRTQRRGRRKGGRQAS